MPYTPAHAAMQDYVGLIEIRHPHWLRNDLIHFSSEKIHDYLLSDVHTVIRNWIRAAKWFYSWHSGATQMVVTDALNINSIVVQHSLPTYRWKTSLSLSLSLYSPFLHFSRHFLAQERRITLNVAHHLFIFKRSRHSLVHIIFTLIEFANVYKMVATTRFLLLELPTPFGKISRLAFPSHTLIFISQRIKNIPYISMRAVWMVCLRVPMHRREYSMVRV